MASATLFDGLSRTPSAADLPRRGFCFFEGSMEGSTVKNLKNRSLSPLNSVDSCAYIRSRLFTTVFTIFHSVELPREPFVGPYRLRISSTSPLSTCAMTSLRSFAVFNALRSRLHASKTWACISLGTGALIRVLDIAGDGWGSGAKECAAGGI